MIAKPWFQDTIARRFATTIILAIFVAVAMAWLFVTFAGPLMLPPLRDTGLLQQADGIVRMVETVPVTERQMLADAASTAAIHVDWYVAGTAVAVMLDAAARLPAGPLPPGFQTAQGQRSIAAFQADTTGSLPPSLRYDRLHHPDTRFFAVMLADQSWVVLTTTTRLWGLEPPVRIAIGGVFLTLSAFAVSAIATYQLAKPITRFTEAVQRFGSDPRSLAVPETGPRELRVAVRAFNAMQAQIQRFVEGRTAMLAAISHDLRTPLTRMRLRAELVDDEDQRHRLFRDVDDMQAMIESALSFFRDDSADEETTRFDFPELLRTIADDYGDQGIEVPYHGPIRASFRGRPFALKRAFTNLVDNAIKYATAPEITLRIESNSVCVQICDRGPGVPEEEAEQVFAPFYRLERSRNRATGGVGLGLTAARAVIRSHGGEITLHNRPSGGLKLLVTLPAPPLGRLA
jgi:signal transduction histidine kinase